MVFESELAKQVFESKYLLEGETSADDAVQRIIESVCKIYPELRGEAKEYIDKQWFIPAGGIWRASGNPNQNVSHINCTTLTPVEDNLESIFDSLYKWSKYAAFGQGEGIDISNLRPRGSKVHNSSRSSTGAVSFMYLYDMVLKIISQQGRRGASLISMKDTHPDLYEFISIKDKPESDKSRIDTANISIQVSDKFMESVEADREWTLIFKDKYEVIEKTISAREAFTKICDMAWKRGDPGLQFTDTASRYSNSNYLGYPVLSTNACGEQYLDPENVCNLSHINLAKFYEFGWEGFKKLTIFGVKFLNAVRYNEILERRSPLKVQGEKLVALPRSGLGVTGLADYLIDNNIRYGSPESIKAVHDIFSKLAKYSYETGYELAKEYGSFPAYNSTKMKESPFVKRLISEGIVDEQIFDYQFNVCYNTIAPVGSGSLISNCGGSGIEPLFSKYMVRRERATTNEWKDWFTFNPYVERYLKKHNMAVTRENAEALTDDKWAMSYDVDPIDKISLVAEAQRWVDSSISVTFNIPNEASKDIVSKIYMLAWKKELKGVTVYREGSLSGVIVNEKNYKEQQKKDIERDQGYEPRPQSLECDIYETKYKDNNFIVLIGLKNDAPYEVFITPNLNKEIDVEKYKKGKIVKQGSGRYDLVVENGVVKTMINNIGKTFDSMYGTLSRLVSMSLRHHVPIPFIIDQLNKDSGFVAFEKVLSRILKKYIKDNTLSKKTCPECGAPLIYTDGCLSCSACSYSKCD